MTRVLYGTYPQPDFTMAEKTSRISLDVYGLPATEQSFCSSADFATRIASKVVSGTQAESFY